MPRILCSPHLTSLIVAVSFTVNPKRDMSTKINGKRKAADSAVTKSTRKKVDGVQSTVWLVFVTEETGSNGYYGGYGNYDNGSHSATLKGVYTSESEAKRHAATLRKDTDEDSDYEEDEVPCERRSVKVVPAPVRSNFDSSQRGDIWTFEADTDLDAPRNH